MNVARDRASDELQDGGLRTSRPPASFRHVRTWVVDSTQQLAGLRTALIRELTGTDSSPLSLDTVAHAMVLVASELATNALRHGIPPTIVRLLQDGRTLLLDVADHDLSTKPYVAGERPPGHGGFGLQIARRLAVEVGWYATETTKHVWARFPAPGTVAPEGTSNA